MSAQKGQKRLRAESVLREKGYDPETPEFSNLGTNELVRRANEMKKATKYDDEPDEEVKNENKVEESALEHAFRDSVVERIKKLEDKFEVMISNQNTMMTAINKLGERVKSLEERPSNTEDRQEYRVKMVEVDK